MNSTSTNPPPIAVNNDLWYWSLISYAAFALALPYYAIRILTTTKYRSGLRQRLTLFSSEEQQKLKANRYIWMHTVSVGELMAARPIIERLKIEFPAFKILVTTVTETGQDLAQKLDIVDTAIYLPLDIFSLCRKVMSMVDPACLIIMETELWPNFIRSAVAANIPLFLVNARLSDKSFKNYLRFKRLFKPILTLFTGILAQSEQDRQRFLQIGAPDSIVSAMGNIKFEAASQIGDSATRQRWRELFQIKDHELLLLGGSTFPGEESLLVQVALDLLNQDIPIRLVIAPRHVERSPAIFDELNKFDIPVILRSQINDQTEIDSRAVILMDTIGELGQAYSAADIVFMGKSICGRGGQNPIEPAAWGKPILFGKNMQNFRDIAPMLINGGAAQQVAGQPELSEACLALCQSPELRSQMGRMAQAIVKQNQGALDHIVQAVSPILREASKTR